MSMPNGTKATLAKVEKLLSQVVKSQTMKMVTPENFVVYAVGEIAKAQNETFEKSQVRLSLLYKSVLYSSAIIEDTEADNVKIPIFVADQTTLDEQENITMTPAEAAAKNPSNQTFFEGGPIAKAILELQKSIEQLGKMEGEESEEEKAKKAFPPPAEGEDEETEKAKGKKPFPPPPAAAAAPPAAPAAPAAPAPKAPPSGPAAKPLEGEEEEKKKSLAKADGTNWPDDLNDPEFITKGEQAGPAWGKDGSK